MAPQYKLTYFPIKGLAESIRYLLSYLGADFEDNRIEFEQWPTIKPTTPFGKLPLLEIDGKTVCQSIAIARYLGKKAGIAGDNEWEALMIDEAVDTYRDLLQEMSGWFTEQDPEKKAKKLETLTGTTVPFYLGKFENLIAENDGYVANKKLSWGDIVIVALLEVTNSNVDLNLSEYPNVKGLFDKVLAIPNIKSWIDRRPEDKKRPT